MLTLLSPAHDLVIIHRWLVIYIRDIVEEILQEILCSRFYLHKV